VDGWGFLREGEAGVYMRPVARWWDSSHVTGMLECVGIYPAQGDGVCADGLRWCVMWYIHILVMVCVDGGLFTPPFLFSLPIVY
jgi:hypothetical protein